jgi:hypothetical protein
MQRFVGRRHIDAIQGQEDDGGNGSSTPLPSTKA